MVIDTMPSLLDRRRAHATMLVRPGPSPQPHHPLGLHLGVPVRYLAGGLELVGLFAAPHTGALTRRARAPALLYLHGGWALDDVDMLDCRAFLDAGFCVFAPAWRGENGNPGVHEMLYGELDDALAALAWLRARADVDRERLFVLGYSAGGMLAALMALVPELGVCMTGSVNGIYDASVFDQQLIPFVDTPHERALRLLLPYVEELRQPHIACVGADDPGVVFAEQAAARAAAAGLPFESVITPGDHNASVNACIEAYLEHALILIKRDCT